ncbi:MAG: hypothetical protein ACM3UU_09910 [Ignavibacteriales bacterium]
MQKARMPKKWNEIISWTIRAILIIAIVAYLFTGRFDGLFVLVITLMLTFYPNVLEKRFRVYLPSSMQIIITVFIFAAQFLGELRGFYDRFWWWDIMLHTTSGFILGIIGFMFVYMLNQQYDKNVNLSPFFIVLFAFCFALTIGVIWEFYEFGMDRIFGLNMQKFRNPGEDGLVDTMVDLIVDAVGAGVVSIFGFLYIKQKHDLFFTKLFSSWFRKEIT